MPVLELPLAEATVSALMSAGLQITEQHTLSGQAKYKTSASPALQQKGVTHRQRRVLTSHSDLSTLLAVAF